MSENEVSTGAESETVVQRKKIKFNQGNMTLGDLEDFEEITGKTFSQAMKQTPVIDPETGKPVRDPDPEAKGRPLMQAEMSMKGLVAIVYLAMRKEDPNFTLEEARKLKLSDFEIDMSDPEAGKSDSGQDSSAPTA